jgi:hypothetical protein
MAAPKGHPRYGPGRKGSPNKVTVSLRDAIMNAFTTVGGEAYLVKVARKNPQVFCMLLARILPLQLQASKEGGLQSPASKIAETLELLRTRVGPAQLQYLGEKQREESMPPN